MVLDYTTNLHYFWALLPEFILCGWGMFILILGVSGKRDPRSGGDLAARKLLPAIHHLSRDGHMSDRFAIHHAVNGGMFLAPQRVDVLRRN